MIDQHTAPHSQKPSIFFTTILIVGIVGVLLFGLDYIKTHIPAGRYTYTEVILSTDTEPEHRAHHILAVSRKREYVYSLNREDGFARVHGTYVRNINGTVDFYAKDNITSDDTTPTIQFTTGQRLFYLTPATSTNEFIIHWDVVSPLTNDAAPLFQFE